MYARRFYKKTPPPDYSGVAFADARETDGISVGKEALPLNTGANQKKTPAPEQERAGGVDTKKRTVTEERSSDYGIPLFEERRMPTYGERGMPRGFSSVEEREEADFFAGETGREESLPFESERIDGEEALLEERMTSEEVPTPPEKEEAASVGSAVKPLSALLKTSFTLEEMLIGLIGLLLLLKEEGDESFLPFLTLLVASL